jgi:hypothetical protein
LLALIGACAFLPSLLGGFVYDDVRLIQENPYVHDSAFVVRAFTAHFWDVSSAAPSADAVRYYRPLVTLSYLVNWLLGAGQAWTFHLTNVLVHALNTWLAWLVTLRWTRSRPLAVASTLVFALHPTRSEVVTWVSGRPDLLMTAFVLLTLQFAHWGRRRESRGAATLAVALCFCGALLSKEPALATPVLLLVVAGNANRSNRTWYLSMVVLTAALGVVYVLLRAWLLPVGSPPLAWTPARALVTVGYFAERTLFPWPLTFFYKLDELSSAGPTYSPWAMASGAFLVAGTVLWLIRAWRRDRVVFWTLVAGVSFLGPLLNLFPTGSRFTTSDRFLYLPLWLFAVAACRSFSDHLVRAWPRGSFRLVAGGVLAVYATANFTRALDFVDEFALWRGELATNPDNPVALRGLSIQQSLQGDVDGAIRNLERSLEKESLRYDRIVTPSDNTDAYGRLVALKASTIPDGSVVALGFLLHDGLDRLAGKPRRARSETLPIDWPLESEVTRVALHGEETLARHLVPVASRLDVRDVSISLLDAVPDEHLHLAANPLNIALAEAREQRFDRAERRIQVMRRSQRLMPPMVTEAALVDLDARIVAARTLFESQGALGQEGRRLDHARGFANLGAFLRALLEVQQVDQRHPGMLPLYVQLLVSARLEKLALEVAGQALGPERAGATIDAIRAQLPPELRNLPPAESTADVSRAPPL